MFDLVTAVALMGEGLFIEAIEAEHIDYIAELAAIEEGTE